MASTSVLPFQSGYLVCSAAQPAGVAACTSMGDKRLATTTAPSAASQAPRALLKSQFCILPAPSNDLIAWSRRCCGAVVPVQARGKLTCACAWMTCPRAHKKLDGAGSTIEQALLKNYSCLLRMRIFRGDISNRHGEEPRLEASRTMRPMLHEAICDRRRTTRPVAWCGCECQSLPAEFVVLGSMAMARPRCAMSRRNNNPMHDVMP